APNSDEGKQQDDAAGQQPQKEEIPQERKQKIASIIQNDEKLRSLLMEDTNKLMEYINSDKNLQAIFSGVDVEGFAERFRLAYGGGGE
ncbi:MAG: hypothetical protein ACOCWQ_00290, partial [Nanoarchaeota archaeon]